MNEILFSAQDGINALLWYHYVGIGAITLAIIVLCILGFISLKKRFLAMTIFFVALAIFLVGTPLLLIAIEDRVRKVDITDLNITMLVYSPVIVVTGNLKSDAMIPINKELYKVRITRVSDNFFLNLRNILQPVEVAYFEHNERLDKNESIPFELLIDYGNKKMPKKFNVYISYKAL
jgi:hypothetical protein